MYLPIFINFAVLAGGFMAWFIGRSGKDERESQARKEQGTLIASGMMAGAAIAGIVAAALRLEQTGFAIRHLSIGQIFDIGVSKTGEQILSRPVPAGYFEAYGEVIGLIMFILLIVGTYFLARWGAKMYLEEEGN
jgi:uncharacterized protein YoaH (UPF0181 family)